MPLLCRGLLAEQEDIKLRGKVALAASAAKGMHPSEIQVVSQLELEKPPRKKKISALSSSPAISMRMATRRGEEETDAEAGKQETKDRETAVAVAEIKYKRQRYERSDESKRTDRRKIR